MSNITIEDIKWKWAEYLGYSTEPDKEEFPYYKEGDVIDEEKSVKWNREEVARRMQLREDESTRLKGLKNNANKEFTYLIIKYIMQETEMNEKQAIIFWNYIELEHHAYMDDAFNALDELIEVHNRIVDAGFETEA